MKPRTPRSPRAARPEATPAALPATKKSATARSRVMPAAKKAAATKTAPRKRAAVATPTEAPVSARATSVLEAAQAAAAPVADVAQQAMRAGEDALKASQDWTQQMTKQFTEAARQLMPGAMPAAAAGALPMDPTAMARQATDAASALFGPMAEMAKTWWGAAGMKLPAMPAMPTLPSSADPAQAFGHAFGDMFRGLTALSLPADSLAKLQSEYVSAAAQLWNEAMSSFQAGGKAPALKDRRFSGQAWRDNPMAAMAAQTYLLNARTLMSMADAVQGDAKTKARIQFAVQQWVDAASPANFLALNADALAKAVETKGESLALGMQQLMKDIRQGHVSQTDESAFEVGRNVAVSEGAVVFENALFQLIEYKPLTARVHERPMLFVPPCINKFYILDLQPDNSVIRYTVEQGHRTFVVSWRNPDAGMAHLGWDDYIAQGPLEAIRVVREIAGRDDINTLGFCVGGTILTTALAVLAARGEPPVNSLTLLTTLLDFSDNGVLDVFVDEAAVQLREMTIGAQSPTGPGLLKGKELATTFSFLRPNDLVWNYVVGNYLKGEAPPPFDLLYWNGDSTNLPGPMYCWYLRHTYLQNELRKPGALTVCGEKIDVTKITTPVFIYASREDHIVPWQSAYRSYDVLAGSKHKTFVLGASGHIAGVINPASKNKRSHWVGGRHGDGAEAWFGTATEQPGSWWPVWSDWLGGHGGRMVAAPEGYGDRKHKAIEPAPGRYVKAKA